MAGPYIAEAARRAAHALVATFGTGSVQLQLPMPPVANDDGEELGLRTPLFQAVTVAPSTVSYTAQHTELLVPADPLEAALSVEGSGATATALLTVTTVQVGDELYVVTDVEPVSIGGRECLYRIVLRAQGTELV